MNVEHQPSATKAPAKICILLMDSNSERRALRTRIMALHGVEVVGAGDLAEAASIWHRDRYDVVLIDIRRDHLGCLAWRDEIKKEKPDQIVGFLVGRPHYIALEPREDSYVAEKPGVEWGDSLRQAVRKSCDSLQQRNGLAEAIWRITGAKKISGAGIVSTRAKTTQAGLAFPNDANQQPAATSSASRNTGPKFEPLAGEAQAISSRVKWRMNEN